MKKLTAFFVCLMLSVLICSSVNITHAQTVYQVAGGTKVIPFWQTQIITSGSIIQQIQILNIAKTTINFTLSIYNKSGEPIEDHVDYNFDVWSDTSHVYGDYNGGIIEIEPGKLFTIYLRSNGSASVQGFLVANWFIESSSPYGIPIENAVYLVHLQSIGEEFSSIPIPGRNPF